MKSSLTSLSQIGRTTFVSLRHRNFRIFCGGIIASLLGTWMQIVVFGWLAFKISHSTAVLGMLSLASLLPTLLLSVPGGWVASRFDRRKILLVTQSIALLQALTVTYLTATGQVQVWHLIALSGVLGALVAFDLAARFPLIAELVKPNEIGNAMNLDHFIFYGARAIGPALGALLIPWIGPEGCFGINAASYAVEILALWAINKPPSPKGRSSGTLAGAWRFLLGDRRNRGAFILMMVTSYFCSYLAMMPAYVGLQISESPTVLGLLVAVTEIGALGAQLWLAYRGSVGIKVFAIASLGAAAGLMALSQVHSPYGACPFLILLGGMFTITVTGCHATMQERVTDADRGMMSSMYWMTSLGLQSAGAFSMGLLAEHTGMGTGVLIGACAGILAALVAMLACRTPEKQ